MSNPGLPAGVFPAAIRSRRIPYRARILAYCERNGIAVPHGFDASKSSDKFALIDLASTPPTLVKNTTCFEREVIEYLARPENRGCLFRILDFKRGVELRHDGGARLAKGEKFECHLPGELRSLVLP